MNNNITEQGYAGTICFAKSVEYGYFTTFDCTEEGFKERTGGDYVLLGSCEVDVQFDTDTRAEEIAALEKRREEIRGKMAAAIAQVDDRIEKLRALPNFSSQEECES